MGAPERYDPGLIPTDQEVRRLLAVTLGSGRPGCRKYHAMFRTMANVGLRITEALRLRGRDFDPKEGTLRIRTLKVREPEGTDTLLLGKKTQATLRAWIKRRKIGPDDRLFRVSRQAAWRAFQRYARLAGWPDALSLHSFRHLAGTVTQEDTGDSRFTQYRLRHRSAASTARYVKVRRARERELLRQVREF